MMLGEEGEPKWGQLGGVVTLCVGGNTCGKQKTYGVVNLRH